MSLIKGELRPIWPLEIGWPEDRIDRVFRDMFRNFFGGEGLLDRVFEGRSTPMRVEEFIEDDTFVIRVELPGIDPTEDVEITVADGTLHLHAVREERKEEDKPTGYRSEFQYGSLDRSVRLPEGATDADVKATYKDGILEVRVPAPKALPEPPRPTKIPINQS